MLVDGVTKLDKVTYGDAAQAETVRKMVVAMARDIRVLVIKLADRLHNARTWRYVSPESAQRKARETLEIYAPLAHRLGMNTIKWELEDLSFATLYPKVYDEIVRLVAERAPAREEYLAGVREQVSEDLRAAKIKATVTGRPKHYYSVYQKMIVRGRDFEDIYDLVGGPGPGRLGARLLRGARRAARAVEPGAGAVQGLHRDAQVQHVPVAAHDGDRSRGQARRDPDPHPHDAPPRRVRRRRALEVQGGPAPAPAAGAQGRRDRPINDMAWLRQLLDWQKETADPGEFLDSLRFEINAREVYVFTPKGERRRRCRPGRRPVDFAYAVHTEVGHHCIGARVNGRLVPLESTLENGDVVEVLTSKADGAGPVARLADLRQAPAGPQQDPAVVLQGAPRGGDRDRQGRDRQGACASRACRSSGCMTRRDR